MSKILIIAGDGGESYEALFAAHRFEEEGWEAVIAAPARRRLNLVMHDFKPGSDTYIERRGYEHVRAEAELAGGIFVGDQAVRHGRLITAQTWQSHPAFYREIFAQLSGKASAARS